MKKMTWLYTILCVSVVCAGCGGSVNTNKKVDEKTESAEASIEQEAGSFPEKYEKISDSGKVTFNCKLEMPENMNANSIKAVTAEGLYQCDREKAWTMFGEGKEVIEEQNTSADKARAQTDYYRFPDEESLSIGAGVFYGSTNFRYYSYIGAMNSDNMAAFEGQGVTFKKGEECLEEVKKTIKELGYHVEDFDFKFYPLNYQVMKNLEEEYVKEELLPEDKRKETWSQDDDAYFIYAYQENEGVPIFHEMMSIARQMAYDTPDNAPIQVIYSARGIEYLNISGVYNLKNTEELLPLKSFEEIGAVVEEKFENVLNDANYEVTRAKFYERVSLNEEQRYIAEPIWYFEVIENDISKSVTLVNANTGKEIFLP
ncbi:MAG: hypothetical protein Q4D16_14175 [Eubacteriales bacterium]|nr:hypothetical protein [Eubacteriales bacterium]